MSDEADVDHGGSMIGALPSVARLAARGLARTGARGLSASLNVGSRLVRVALDPGYAAELVEEVRSGVRTYARSTLGINDLDERVKQMSPADGRHAPRRDPAKVGRFRRARQHVETAPASRLSLRARAAQLLRQSADVTPDEGMHPAYARILQEIAPDEARILRLLCAEGPQPSVDVSSTNLIGASSERVQQRLNMIGRQAGCQHDDRLESYLHNLERLGLIEFSREPVDDPSVYLVLEAQPHVMQAIDEASRAKTEQGSIRLSTFGKDFCAACLPLDMDEVEALTEPT